MSKLWEPKRGADYLRRLIRMVQVQDARVTLWKTVIVAMILFVALAVDAQVSSRAGALGPATQSKSSAPKAANSFSHDWH